MNLKLETSFLELLRQKDLLYDAYLSDLANYKIAVDACLLLKMAAPDSDPYKYA